MQLHPVVAKMLDAQADRPLLHTLSVAEARGVFSSTRALLGPGPAQVHAQECALPTRAGHIGCRLLWPEGPPAGLVVYFHGGGWILGELDDFDALGRHLCRRSGCVVALVDYRLAPEHVFPAAVEDAEDAVLALAGEAGQTLGLGGLPVVVAGDSAGGNLAAVVALELRGRVTIALQLLVNPVTDTAQDTESYRSFANGYLLTAGDMAWFLAHYAPGADPADPRLAVLRRDDLAGAPPAWIATAEFDVLRDEGEAFARKLEAAGNRATLQRQPGMIHGFARMSGLVDTADAALEGMAAAIRAAVLPDGGNGDVSGNNGLGRA